MTIYIFTYIIYIYIYLYMRSITMIEIHLELELHFQVVYSMYVFTCFDMFWPIGENSNRCSPFSGGFLRHFPPIFGEVLRGGDHDVPCFENRVPPKSSAKCTWKTPSNRRVSQGVQPQKDRLFRWSTSVRKWESTLFFIFMNSTRKNVIGKYMIWK